MVSIEPGDVVQISPSHRTLGGCFAVVDDVKGWGVLASVPVASYRIAPVRLGPEEFVKIGRATWTLTEMSRLEQQGPEDQP